MSNEDIKIAVVGGDLRQLVAARNLAAEGYETAAYGFGGGREYGDAVRAKTLSDAVHGARVVVLPVHFSQDGKKISTPLSEEEIYLGELLRLMEKDQFLLAGVVSKAFYGVCEARGITVEDYMANEELAVMNAVPTAEGALSIAIEASPKTIKDSKIIVIGYGRIGKILSRMLRALDADVTVCARRREAVTWAQACGCKGAYMNALPYAEADIIFNTVPTMVLGRDLLQTLPKDTLIIDLASKPGGVDLESAKRLGLDVIWALSLPGKVAPVTAGEYIKETVISLMKRHGILS